MREYPADAQVVSQIETVRSALPNWVVSTVELVELAENAERAAVHSNPETLDRSRKLIVEVAEWQQKLASGRAWTCRHVLRLNFEFSRRRLMPRWTKRTALPAN